MMGRAIFSRHRRYGFYRPSAVTIAMTVADAPNNAAQILVFCVSMHSR
jgi:ATP-binding cassette subfamily G (WHITE) protein 2 (SNQ2)